MQLCCSVAWSWLIVLRFLCGVLAPHHIQHSKPVEVCLHPSAQSDLGGCFQCPLNESQMNLVVLLFRAPLVTFWTISGVFFRLVIYQSSVKNKIALFWRKLVKDSLLDSERVIKAGLNYWG